ncbi:MAG TPA: XrtA system polysaccharide deacetylase [Acetobacteraceae bacterium]|nr:XrtA system polysaccharide deacetylase [Acetobacteraceae bacterium]
MPAAQGASSGGQVNAMTVDVEDWFQVQAFAGTITRDSWDSLPRRVEANTNRILDMFAEAGIVATFFTLGWVAERHGALIRRIVGEGHELASHGYWHRLAHEQSPAAFATDVADARKMLEDCGGVPVIGYRAPTFSINARNPWAFDVLAEQGYRYSSSIYPVRHDLYGMPDAPRFPFRVAAGALLEIPMTTVRLAGRNLPCAGGGYFRLAPYVAFRAALRRFNAAEGASGVFYTHPWEIDAAQPRVVAAPRMARFRHYLNLTAMPSRLTRLLRDFAWGRMDRVFAEAIG